MIVPLTLLISMGAGVKSALQDLSVNLGCYALDSSVVSQSTYIAAMMPALCVDHCASSAFALIAPRPGNKWFYNCLCQDQLPSIAAEASACQRKCIGAPNPDSAPLCGGGSVQNLEIVWSAYQGKGNGVVPLPSPSVEPIPSPLPPPPPPPSPPQSPQPPKTHVVTAVSGPSPQPQPQPQPQPDEPILLPIPQPQPEQSHSAPVPEPQQNAPIAVIISSPQQPAHIPASSQAIIQPTTIQGGGLNFNVNSESQTGSVESVVARSSFAVITTTSGTSRLSGSKTAEETATPTTIIMKAMLPSTNMPESTTQSTDIKPEPLFIGVTVGILVLLIFAIGLRCYCIRKQNVKSQASRDFEYIHQASPKILRSKSNASSAFRFGARSPQVGSVAGFGKSPRPFKVLDNVIDESPYEVASTIDRKQVSPKPPSQHHYFERPKQRSSTFSNQYIETASPQRPMLNQSRPSSPFLASKPDASLRNGKYRHPRSCTPKPAALQQNWNHDPVIIEPLPAAPMPPKITEKPVAAMRRPSSSKKNKGLNRLPSWKSARWTIHTDSGETVTSVIDLQIPESEMDDTESVVSLDL
ncbi:hypothetical protein BDR26DRAFT_874607 [Obelidium mucronatum]|nr:hypothetical protein BDR26DRAFT_874607 [Obelidium mucronatum]